MLEVNGLDVSYGDVPVLSQVSLEVRDGEIVAIIGPNAAGKTTLLRAISGVAPRTRGSIRFNATEISRYPAHQIARMGIVHVPEGRGLFPFLTVHENLRLGAYGVRDAQERERRLASVFQLFPILEERKSQLAGSLSGGEQQMCAIGRGMMAAPSLLMLDEPSLGLAPKIVELVLETIRVINERGTTILLVEQNAVGALSLADRAYVLDSGRIVLHDMAENLKRNEDVRKAYLGV